MLAEQPTLAQQPFTVIEPEAGRNFARAERASFNPSVHGARGLFAMLVFIFHVANSGLATFYPATAWLAQYGFLSLKFGVELFFGISGFVIVGALARSPSPWAFLWDRATRIYPLLWLTLVAITAVSSAVGHWLPPARDQLLNYLAPPPFFPLPQVNPAAWSLGYEMTFYLFCTLCWWARMRSIPWRSLALPAGVLLIVFLPRGILIPAGALVATARFSRGSSTRFTRAPGTTLVLFILLWRWLELHTPGHDIALLRPATTPWRTWLGLLPLELFAGILGALTLQGIALQRGHLTTFLRGRCLQWLGTISFSFYLWHPVIMSVTKSVLIRSGASSAAGPAAQLLFALVALPPSLMIAQVSQAWVEVRLTRWLRTLGPAPASAHAPIAALADTLPTAGHPSHHTIAE